MLQAVSHPLGRGEIEKAIKGEGSLCHHGISSAVFGLGNEIRSVRHGSRCWANARFVAGAPGGSLGSRTETDRANSCSLPRCGLGSANCFRPGFNTAIPICFWSGCFHGWMPSWRNFHGRDHGQSPNRRGDGSSTFERSQPLAPGTMQMGVPGRRVAPLLWKRAALRLPAVTVTIVQNYMTLDLRFVYCGRYHHNVSSGHAL